MPEGHFINDYIAINYSKNDKDDLVHFLTHIETGTRTEDLKDLLSPTASTIFTSPVNAYILKVHFKYEQNVVPIEMGKSYQIYTKNRKMFIFTCIWSYYNCGSMILIARGDFGTIIYTGFCAIDFNSLNVPIVKEIIRQRCLSKLYLDCTYYKNYLEFFSISDIKKVLVQFFRSRKNRFYIHVPIFGLEGLLGDVAMNLEEVMVVDEKRMTLIQFLGLSDHFTLDKSKGRLHVISQGIMKRNNENETSQLVYIKVVNELSNNSNSYTNRGKIHFFTIYPHCTNKECTDIISNTRPDSLIQIGSIKSQNSSDASKTTENATESSNNTLNTPQRVFAEINKYKKDARSNLLNDQSGKTIKVLNRDNQNLKGNVPQKVLANKKSRKRSSESFSGLHTFDDESTESSISNEESDYAKFVEHPYALPPQKAKLVVGNSHSKPRILKTSTNIYKSKNENPVIIKRADRKEILDKCLPSPKKDLNDTSKKFEKNETTPTPNIDVGDSMLKNISRTVSQNVQKGDEELQSKGGDELCLSEESRSVCDNSPHIQPKFKVLQIENESSIQRKAAEISRPGLLKINTDVSKFKRFVPLVLSCKSGYPDSTSLKLMSGKDIPKVVAKLTTNNSGLCASAALSRLQSSQSTSEPNPPESDNFLKNQKNTASGSIKTCLVPAPTKISLLSTDSSKVGSHTKGPLVEKLKRNQKVVKSNEKGELPIPCQVEDVEGNLLPSENINSVDLLVSTKYKVPDNESSISFTVKTELQSEELENDRNSTSIFTKPSIHESSMNLETLKGTIKAGAKVQEPRLPILGRSTLLITENSDNSINRPIVTSLENNDLNNKPPVPNEKLVTSTQELLQNNSIKDGNKIQHCLPLSDTISKEKAKDPSSFNIAKPLISCKFIDEQDLKSLSPETLKGTIEAGAKVQQPNLPILGRSTLLIKENSNSSVNRPVVTEFENPDLSNRSPGSNEKVRLMLIKSKISFSEPPCPFSEKLEVEKNILRNSKGPLGKIESVRTLIPFDKMPVSGKNIDPSLIDESQSCINKNQVLPTVRKLMPINNKPPLAPIKILSKIIPKGSPSLLSSSSLPPSSNLLRKGMEIKGFPTTKINVSSSNLLGTLKKICGKGTGVMNYSNEKVFLTKNSIIIPSHLIRSPPPVPGPSNKFANNELLGTQSFTSNGTKYIRMSKNKLSNIISTLEGQLDKANVQHIHCETEDNKMSDGSVIELSDDSQNSLHDEAQPPEKDACPLVISMKDGAKNSCTTNKGLEQKEVLSNHKEITSTSRLKLKNLAELLTNPSLVQVMTGNNQSENLITTNPSEDSVTKNLIEAFVVNESEVSEPDSVVNTNQNNVGDKAHSCKNEFHESTTGKEVLSDGINCSTSIRVMKNNLAITKKTIDGRKGRRKKSIWFKNINPKRRPYKWKINDSICSNKSVISSVNGGVNNTPSSCLNNSDSSFISEPLPMKDIDVNDVNNTIDSFKGNINVVNIVPDLITSNPSEDSITENIVEAFVVNDSNNLLNWTRVAANTHELLKKLKRTETEKNLLKQFGICNELIICIKNNLENSSGYKYNYFKKCFMLKKRRGRPPKLDTSDTLNTSESHTPLPLNSEDTIPPILIPFYEDDNLEFQASSRSLMEDLKMTPKELAQKKHLKSQGSSFTKQSDFKTAVRRIAPFLSHYDQTSQKKFRKKRLIKKLTPFVGEVKSASKTLTDSKDTLEVKLSNKNGKEEKGLSLAKRSYNCRKNKSELHAVTGRLRRSKYSLTRDQEEKSMSPDTEKESPPIVVPEVIEPLTNEKLAQGDVDNGLNSISSHKDSTQLEDLNCNYDTLPELEKSTENSSLGCKKSPQQNIDFPPSLEVTCDSSKSCDHDSKNQEKSIEKGSDNLCLSPQSAVPNVDNEKSSNGIQDSLTVKSSDGTNLRKSLRSRKKICTSRPNEFDKKKSNHSSPDHSCQETDPSKSSVEETTPSDILSHVKNRFQYFSRPSSFGRQRKVHPKLLKSSCYMLSHLTSKKSQIKEINSSLNLEK